MTALDIDFVRAQFPAFAEPSLQGQAFFENAGGSYTCRQVIDRLIRFYTQRKVQPYAAYEASRLGGEEMDEARARLAALMGVATDELSFGPSTTQNTYVLAQAFRKFMTLVRRATYLLGFVSPVLAAFGYVNAAEALIYPAASTLALLAALLVLQRFLGDVYGWLSGKGSEARDSLFAVLIGFLLVTLALPLLALIWGARVADLTELWSRFLEGFQIGGTRISPTAFLTFAIVFAIGYALTRLVQGSLRNSLLPKTKIDPGGQNAITSGLGYVGIFLAAVVAISMTAKKVALSPEGALRAIQASIGIIATWPSGDSTAVSTMAIKRASTTPPVIAAVQW